MTTISFDYKPWTNEDVSLERPGAPLGYAVVNSAINVSYAPTVKQGNRDSIIGPAIEGVIELLAGSLEWCREYGLTPQDVQSKVNAFKRKNRGTNSSRLTLDLQRTNVNSVSDPRNRLHKQQDPAKIFVQ